MQDRIGEPEWGRGSEWEPIKFLLKNSAYELKVTRKPPALLLPNPRSQ
jgi:hypothetical protein